MTRYTFPSPPGLSSMRRRALHVAMLVANTGAGDARVMKEAESLVAQGHEVTVFCLAGRGLPSHEQIAGVRYVRLRERHKGPDAGTLPASGLPRPAVRPGLTQRLKAAIAPFIQHELHAATFSRPVASSKPGIIHAHDFETLPAAVRAAAKCGARVVYDMHELEEGRLPAAGPLLARWKRWLESRALRRVAATITVSPSIASYKARAYGIPLPTVVLNAPRLSLQTAATPALRERCGLPPGTPLGVYVGVASLGRGIEQLVAALVQVPDFHLALLGSVRPELRAHLQHAAACLRGRLHLLDPVPHDDVVTHIASADFGVATIPGSCLNYEFCLPNKLFEMTFAGLPVLVSNTTEMKRFVAETGTGLAVDAQDVAAISAGLRAVYADRGQLRPDAAKLEALRARFGWQRQAEHLIEVYDAVANGPRGLPVRMARRALATSLRPAGAFAAGN